MILSKSPLGATNTNLDSNISIINYEDVKLNFQSSMIKKLLECNDKKLNDIHYYLDLLPNILNYENIRDEDSEFNNEKNNTISISNEKNVEGLTNIENKEIEKKDEKKDNENKDENIEMDESLFEEESKIILNESQLNRISLIFETFQKLIFKNFETLLNTNSNNSNVLIARNYTNNDYFKINEKIVNIFEVS